jgi:hypothetical protein
MAKRLALIVAMLFIPALAKADSTDQFFTYQSGVFTLVNMPEESIAVYQNLGFNTCLGNCNLSTALPAGCQPWAVNASQQIVGDCLSTTPNSPVGFIDSNGMFTYVTYHIPNNGDFTETIFVGINDAGEVLGVFSTVPEPSSLISLLVGFAALALGIYARGNRWTVGYLQPSR